MEKHTTWIALVLLAAGLMVACAPPQAPHATSGRIQVVDGSGTDVRVLRDTKTGCEFINSEPGYGSALALIPGTCGGASK